MNENNALKAEADVRSSVEMARDYEENFDILETITNVGNDEVFTPRKIVEMMLDSLPEEVWKHPEYKWLNPATKNGVFEREIALRLDEGLRDLIPNQEERRKHILKNMIYAIGETKFTANVARRTLYYCSQANRKCDGEKANDGHYVNGFAIGNGTWFDDEEGNILTPNTDHEFRNKKHELLPIYHELTIEERKNYICEHCGLKANSVYNDESQDEHYAYEFIHVNHLKLADHLTKRFTKGKGGDRMHFDIIIGNPPYQLSDGGAGASAKPIYNLFVDNAKKLNPKYLCMIIPARWLFDSGKGSDLKDFAEEMLKDPQITVLHDFPDSSMVFPTDYDIKGGIVFFLRERDRVNQSKTPPLATSILI